MNVFCLLAFDSCNFFLETAGDPNILYSKVHTLVPRLKSTEREVNTKAYIPKK